VKDELAQQLVEYLNSGETVVEEESKVKSAVTIYVEVTPNPAVLKFVANKRIVPAAFEFKNIDEAAGSELAKKLFHLPFVKEVFMDENYVSVTKYEMADWNEVSGDLRGLIREFIASGKPAVSEDSIALQKSPGAATASTGPMDDTSMEIIAILEEYVKPAVASDGGNILFQSYEADSKTVNVILQGACSGCPSSTYTLKNGIENMLREMMGDKVQEVVAING
jgi:Fe-S cluster biogenesis protein NfuA